MPFPAALVETPMPVAMLFPAVLTPRVTGAFHHVATWDPDVRVAVPSPVAARPNVMRLTSWHHFYALCGRGDVDLDYRCRGRYLWRGD
jgi:hypothetical protein